MPRKARDPRLDTRTARLRLSVRREPYWRTIQEGRALGYRRLPGGKAGTWIARHYSPVTGQRLYQSLGAADDLLEASGGDALTFAQAQDRAAEWFRQLARQEGRVVEPLTVAEAVDDYLADYTTRGGKALAFLKTTFSAHVLPTLGEKSVADLTTAAIRRWHHSLAEAPARLRSAAKAKERKVRKPTNADHQRARRSTANNVLTMLKAALNLAYREGKVPSDDAWRRVKPFEKVDAARIRYLNDEESTRLVNACPADLRALVAAALLTGCRYQELAALRASDVDLRAGVLHVRASKGGKSRSVILTEEAAEFFRQKMAGKAADALLLTRTVELGDEQKATAWGKSHQFRPLRRACVHAKISPPISFHILRHTHASRLAMKGVPMQVIAAQLGHASTKITERHYAHLAPGYVADTIRAAFGSLGLVPASNITEFPWKESPGAA